MYAIIQAVHQSAVENGGFVTSEFSQVLPPASAITRQDPATAAGICQGLVNRWIAAHAAGGSLWNEIYGQDSRGRHTFNVSLLQQIGREQKVGGASGAFGSASGWVAQATANERWLASKNIIPWSHPVLDIYSRMGEAAKESEASKLLTTAIASFRPTDGAYLNIALHKSGTNYGGHAVGAFIGSAAWGTGKREVLFFDPNVGEFWFDDRDNFSKWLRVGLLQILTRQANYAYKAFSISAFAPRARRVG